MVMSKQRDDDHRKKNRRNTAKHAVQRCSPSWMNIHLDVFTLLKRVITNVRANLLTGHISLVYYILLFRHDR